MLENRYFIRMSEFLNYGIALSVLMFFPSLIPYLAGFPVEIQSITFLFLFCCFLLKRKKIKLMEVLGIVALFTLVIINTVITGGYSSLKFFFYFFASFIIISVANRRIITIFTDIFTVLCLLAVFNFFMMGVVGTGSFITPNGREYITGPLGLSTGNVMGVSAFFRQTGLFEEPGIFGSIAGALLFNNSLAPIQRLVIVLGGVVSGSLAFVAIAGLSAFANVENLKWSVIKGTVAIGLGSLVLFLFNRDVYLYLTQRLLSFVLGGSYGDTRSHVYEYVISMPDFIYSIFFGVGSSALKDTGFSIVSLPSVMYVYGLPVVSLSFALIFAKAFDRRFALYSSVVVVLFLYQRPNFYEPVFALVILVILSRGWGVERKGNGYVGR
ncbi:hypothetical protein [Halomonas sp. S2151]|uniref:hypothetical protein n=1 Tax=Halomonas sp. S2151 TaxID=579478 RepID=UPI000AB057F9|nr:hypothetical protein [Halomonas sp. S2151]